MMMVIKMKFKYEGFFSKKNESCVKTPAINFPKINRGGINIDHGGCYDRPSISITVPHISNTDEKTSKNIAKEHTYTFKL